MINSRANGFESFISHLDEIKYRPTDISRQRDALNEAEPISTGFDGDR